MARPDQEAIDTFMSITSVSEAEAIRKLEEHQGNLNEAVNAHFSDGDRDRAQGSSFVTPQHDLMDIDDLEQIESRGPSNSLHFPRDLNPFSLLDSNFTRSIFNTGTNFTPRSPFVSHPRVVREIPIEVKDGEGALGHSSGAPIIEDITENVHDHGPEIHGTVVLDDEEDNVNNIIPNVPTGQGDTHGSQVSTVQSGPSAPSIVDIPENDIEEEMLRAAIEASKQDAVMSGQQYDQLDSGVPTSAPAHSHLEDAELAHAVSLSLQTAETEKALRDLDRKVDSPELETQNSAVLEELGKVTPSNGRLSQLELGSSSIQDEAEDVDDEQLHRHRRRHVSSSSIDMPKDNIGSEVNPPYSPRQNDKIHSQNSGSDFPSAEWGGISSEEHDEAVMLEAAMFGGIPEGSDYHFPYGPHQFMQSGLDGPGPYARRIPQPPSPSLTAQRLIREQQDDEYLASLQADREKELKFKEEAEAALAEERHKAEELHRKQQEEQEIGSQLAAKEASLPQEPALDDDNAVTPLVRMPDGSRKGRRFLKSDKLRHLFDFIDVGRGVKPGGYRLVRPYPRRAFGDGETTLSLNELGLTSRQEALYLEFI